MEIVNDDCGKCVNGVMMLDSRCWCGLTFKPDDCNSWATGPMFKPGQGKMYYMVAFPTDDELKHQSKSIKSGTSKTRLVNNPTSSRSKEKHGNKPSGQQQPGLF